VVKQGRSSRVGVAIRRQGSTIQVRVEGEGVSSGIPGDTTLGGLNRLGLFSIRERLVCLGGDLLVDTETGPGTGVTLVLPLKH
jgi:signal transduction histidine kinase